MIALGPLVERQLDALLEYYADKSRPEAIRGLGHAVREALRRIERDAASGLPAPRPYPELARYGMRWIKQGRYRFAYSVTEPPVVLSVFFDQADLVSRIEG